MLLPLFLEGANSAFVACSLVLLIPAALLTIARRERPIAAIVGFVLSVAFISWLRFSGQGAGWNPKVAATALGVSALLALKFSGNNNLSPSQTDEYVTLADQKQVNANRVDPTIVSILSGLLTGLAASEIWVPCVGDEFSVLVNELPGLGIIGLRNLTLYILGILLPAFALVAALYLTPSSRKSATGTMVMKTASVLLLLFAAAIFFDQHLWIIEKLYLWSR